MSLRTTHYYLALLLTVCILLVNSTPVAAQGGDGQPPDPPGGEVVHVVQPNENLFRIALHYGTTVDVITAANGISDPRYLAVGQRLIIPNAQTSAAPVTAPDQSTSLANIYTVMPGDSIFTIATAHQTSLEQLIANNYITNPRQLYAGQTLTVTSETTGSAPAFRHVVKPGENPLRIALLHSVQLTDLLRANQLSLAHPLFAGQQLRIPGSNPTGTQDLPAPFVSITLSPVPAVQGQTLEVHFSTEGPASITGTFMNDPLTIVTQDATEHFAVIGIHAFTASGIYRLRLEATAPNNPPATFKQNIRVIEGGYGSEMIAINADKQDLLNTDVTEPEWQRVAMVMSGFTAQRYFDGPMQLPSSGPVTSTFGTRRLYNGDALNTFHSGTDFGSGPGTPILAPAAGVVVLTESFPVRGNATIIDHGWGVLTGYWHQEQIQVAVGDIVAPGQIIGTIGTTGRSTGPHLHWEMWVSGVQVDPMQWTQQAFP